MESSILGLLGPYQKKFEAQLGGGGRQATAQSSQSQKAQAQASLARFGLNQKSTPVTLTFGASARPPSSADKNKASSKANLPAYHKKQNIKFIGGADTRRAGRVAEMEIHRKALRTETLMSKRMGRMGTASTNINENDLDLSNGNDLSQESINRSTNNKNKSGSGGEEPNIKISDARKAQLLKWKQEKNVFDDKNAKKPPFRPGGQLLNGKKATGTASASTVTTKPPPATASARTQRPPSATAPPRTQVQRPPSGPASSAASSRAGVGSTGTGLAGERRVTRAMAKTQPAPAVPQVPVTKSNATTKSVVKPPTSTLKNLNLSGRNGQTDTKKPTTAVATGSRMGGRMETDARKKTATKPPAKTTPPKSQPKQTAKSSANAPVTPVPIPLPIEKPAVVKKKLKPKGIDPIYTEYNLTFSKACDLLTNHSKYWRNVVETNKEINDDMRDDIISALGKAKLLLDSKLPQFTELLYSYICKEVEPNPVLQCDLQGWWDVASIQVEAVDTEFLGLKTLESNGWLKPQAEKIIKPKKKAKDDTPKTPAKTVQASKGIKAFLAMKRNQGQAEPTSSKSEISENKEIITKKKSASPVAFEGGFFVVSSPARKTPSVRAPRSSLRLAAGNGKKSLCKTPGAGTPQQRLSNVGLRMLSMRNSMGPIYKIGVINDLYAETEEVLEVEEQSLNELNENAKMDICED